MDIMGIPVNQVLPQKPPFLMIDSVLKVDADAIECLKLLSHNEPYFAGHFPANPVFPGVLLQEACAQASLLLAMSWGEGKTGGIGYLVDVKEFRIYRPSVPGSSLTVRAALHERVGPYLTTDVSVVGADGKSRIAKGRLTFYWPEAG